MNREPASDALILEFGHFRKKHISQPSYIKFKILKVTGELAFVRVVLYRRIVNFLKRTEIDNKSDAVHG